MGILSFVAKNTLTKMEKPVAVFGINGTAKILKIYQDEPHESPNDWGNEDIFLVYDHRQFTVKREGFEPRAIFDHVSYPPKPIQGAKSADEYAEELEEWENEKPYSYEEYHIFPVYAYIHSGVALSLGRNKYPFNDRWDVSSTGFLLIKKEEFPDKTDEYIFSLGEGTIKEWNQYLSGEIYRFDIVEQKECTSCHHIEEKELDSCGGFYGDDYEAIFDHIGVTKDGLTEIKEGKK